MSRHPDPSCPSPPPSTSGFRRLFMVIGALAMIGAIGLVAWQATRPATPQANGPMVSPNAPETIESKARREEVTRMEQADKEAQQRRDAQAMAAGLAPEDARKQAKRPDDPGLLPAVKSDVSPQAAAAYQAGVTKTHPERLSSAIAEAPFNAERWKADAAYRAEYLRVPAPSRAFLPAQPAPGVSAIRVVSGERATIHQGETHVFRVVATAGYPVTATSLDALRFANTKLTTCTTVADEHGVATFTMEATPGVINNCRIQVACPGNSGLAQVLVVVPSPVAEQSLAQPVSVR